MAKILIVDDRAINREYLVTLLGYSGHQMLEATDGVQALETVHAEHPDLVICDVLMPRMDGYEFVRQLRIETTIANTKVIFFSASYIEREAHDLAKAGGVLEVLTKPCAPEEIIRVVERALSHATPVAPIEHADAFERQHLRLITDKLSEKEEEQRAVSQRLETLVELSLKLGSESDPHRLLDVVCEDARQLIGAKQCLLMVRKTNGDDSIHFSTAGFDSETVKQAGQPRLDQGVLGRVMTEGRSYRTASSLKTIGLPAGYMPAKSFLAAPITSLHQNYGWICLTDKLQGTDFSLEDERQLTVLGAQVGRIYENGSMYYKIQQHAAQLEIQIAEKVRAEQGLRESERRFSDMLRNVELVSLMLDREARITYCNDYLLRLTGRTREEVFGKDWFELFIPPELDETRGVFADLLADLSRAWHHENEILTRFGERRLIRWNNTVLRSISGEVIGTASIGEDITERKQIEEEIRETRNFFASIFDNIPNSIFIKDAKDLRFVRVNPACEKLTGYSEKEFLGKSDYDFFPKEQADFFVAKDRETLAGNQRVFIVEETITSKVGTEKILQTKKFPILDKDGHPQYLLGMSEDITERKQHEQRIARLSRIQQVLSGINSAIVRIRDRQELFEEACRIIVEHGRFSVGWIAKLDKESGRLVSVAQAGLPMDLGAGRDSSNRPAGLMPGGTAEVALREKRPAFDNDVERGLGVMDGKVTPDTLSVRREAIRLGAKSVIVLPLFVEGQTFGVLTLYAPERNFFDDEELKLLTELAGDVSFGLEFIAKEEKVDYLAYYDTLTGLPNRSLFVDRLTHQLGTAMRDGLNVALVIMDLDRFRLVNDTLGRQAGDTLINTVAKRIKDNFRDQDTVARVGADSFAVAVSGTWRAPDAAHVLESHNHNLFGQPFALGKEELRLTATSGIAVFPDDGDNPEKLFANAEAALRKAKEENARFLFYSPEMNARVADSLRLENRLRRALENGEMVLWYQPKVSVRTRKLTGFEALMRWQDPETGMVPPARFIPLMEQTGLILEAGRWALTQVASDCRLWGTSGIKLPRVAVNVSPIQLRQKDFIATVVEAAERTEEAGSMLDLEITESVIMENVEAIIPILQTVRGLGVEIAVDDFGTGYSSLAYIARLPIHDLKIDRSFVIGMTESKDSLAIVRSVISLAHSLRFKVVAEGVETEEQAALLLELGCDDMQGYLISRPVPPEEVLVLLSRQKPPVPDVSAREITSNTKKSKVKKRNMKRH